MPSVRRILPTSTLESGFRAAHNQTVDAIIDASGVVLTPEGVLQFYNDLGVFLGEVDLAAVLALDSRIPLPAGGDPTPFDSATEDVEGIVQLATPDEVVTGEDEFKAVTPATLTYLLQFLGHYKHVITAPLIDGQPMVIDLLPDGAFQIINGPASVAPTIDSVIASGNITNRPARFGPRSELNPFFVNNIQAVKIAYQAVPGGEWFDVLISIADFKSIIRTYFGLTDILANDNYSDGTAVFGGVGLQSVAEANFANKIAVWTDDTIRGAPGHYGAYITPDDLLIKLFTGLSDDSKAFIRSAISATPDVIGTVVGRRCIPGVVSATATERFYIIDESKIGTPQAHGLTGYTPERIVPLLIDANNNSNTAMTIVITATTYLITYPDTGQSEFIGRLILKAFPTT